MDGDDGFGAVGVAVEGLEGVCAWVVCGGGGEEDES